MNVNAKTLEGQARPSSWTRVNLLNSCIMIVTDCQVLSALYENINLRVQQQMISPAQQ